MAEKNLMEYSLSARNIQSLTSEGYSGITFIYVIKGQITVCTEDRQTLLQTDGLLLINQNSAYEISSETENIVIQLEVSNVYFSRYYQAFFYYRYNITPHRTSHFKNTYIASMQILLAKMMIARIGGNDEFSLLEINRLLSELLLILVLHFKEKDSTTPIHNIPYSRRIENTVQFLKKNYNQNISLQQIADKEHVSFAYLSRLFKQEVGVNYTQFLNQLRFEHAVYDLLNTAKTIQQITEKNGFSSTKYFIELFRQHYGKTPKHFRIEQKNIKEKNRLTKTVHSPKQDKTQQAEHSDLIETLTLLSNIINRVEQKKYTTDQFSPIEEQFIELQTQNKNETLIKPKHIIFVGELNEILKQHVQKQISILKQESRIDYIEASHLISGNIILPEIITDEPVPTDSPYNNTDLIISFLKQNGIRLFVRIYHQSVQLNPEEYIQKTTRFFRHCINLYGIDCVQNWRFIYYEEDSEIIKTAAYERIYFQLRNAIESCLPDAKIGVYCPFLQIDRNEINTFFKGNVAQSIDFLGYTASFSELAGDEYSPYARFNNEATYIQEKTKLIKKHMKIHNMDIPVFLMKWNTISGATAYTNGTFFRAALIFNTLIDLSHHVEGIGMSLNTEIQQERMPTGVDLSSISLFFIENTRRPVFFVIRFLEKLQGKIIARHKDYIVTKTHFGYQVALVNMSIFNPFLSIKEHLTQNFKKKKIFTIKGIQPGNYQIKRHILDQQNGALYTQYTKFKTQFGRDSEVIDYISQQTVPDFSLHDEKIDSGQFVTMAELDINAIHFYELHYIH